MEIYQNKGDYKLLTSPKNLIGQLQNIEEAGRTCYQSFKGEITEETSRKFIKMIMGLGHLSVIEHSNLSVKFFNVSRGFTHEVVRHRLASFSQESTRYVDYAKSGDEKIDLDRFQIKVVAPGHQDINEKVTLSNGDNLSFKQMSENIAEYYRALRKAGWPAEDARQILPNGIKSDIVVSANFRQWRHIFSLRCDKPAHWEIRYVMNKLLLELKPILSPIFDDFELAGQDNNGLDYYVPKLSAR